MTRAEWSEQKICTSRSVVEAEDEYERGCEIFLKSKIGRAKCGNCNNCIMTLALKMTKNNIQSRPVNMVMNNCHNITINIK